MESGVYYLTVQMSDTLDAHIAIKKNGNTLTYTDRSTKQNSWDGEFLNVLVPLSQGRNFSTINSTPTVTSHKLFMF